MRNPHIFLLGALVSLSLTWLTGTAMTSALSLWASSQPRHYWPAGHRPSGPPRDIQTCRLAWHTSGHTWLGLGRCRLTCAWWHTWGRAVNCWRTEHTISSTVFVFWILISLPRIDRFVPTNNRCLRKELCHPTRRQLCPRDGSSVGDWTSTSSLITTTISPLNVIISEAWIGFTINWMYKLLMD